MIGVSERRELRLRSLLGLLCLSLLLMGLNPSPVVFRKM
jgi:hypothetical protein